LTALLTNLPASHDRDLSLWLPDRWILDQKAKFNNLQGHLATVL
jgi:hypothetical protein